MEESELINNYRNKDELAQEALINKYQGLIWYVVHQYMSRYHIATSYQEDLYQEGLIAFDNAVRIYDANNKASFMSFAMVCIRRKVNSFVNRNYLRNNPINTISLDYFINETNEMSLHNVIGTKDNVIKDNYDITALNKLSEFERQILAYRLDGFSYKEIADLLHTQPKKVDNALTSIKKRVKDYKVKGYDFLDSNQVIELDEFENKVYQLRENNVSYKDIASKLEVDVKSVTNAVNRIRRKICKTK